MKDLSLLKPVFAQAALTFGLMFWMGYVRFRAWGTPDVQRGTDGTRPIWLGRAGHVSNAFHNQIEMPILFYAVVAFILIADRSDQTFVVLAWLYVAFRALQATIHTTYNFIPHRFGVFLIGNAVLAIIWIRLAVSVF